MTRSPWSRLPPMQRAGLIVAVAALPGYGLATAIGAFAGDARPAAVSSAVPVPSALSGATSASAATATSASAATSATSASAPAAASAPPRSEAAGQKPPPPSGGCHPYYQPCVPLVSDVDCTGSGDGPVYVTGPIRVVGKDAYHLDPDGDGVACG